MPKKKKALKARKKSARKSPAKKKRSPSKKKAAKKKKSSPRPKQKTVGKMRVEVTKGGRVDNGNKYVWSVTLKGLNGASVPAELVTATTQAEAMAKARRILKSQF